MSKRSLIALLMANTGCKINNVERNTQIYEKKYKNTKLGKNFRRLVPVLRQKW